ncbi:MAG: MerR family transcriptional regulator [Myxococcota bacterium]|nr:MerR family transcriptional regulator [Myxococcota bacterium]
MNEAASLALHEPQDDAQRWSLRMKDLCDLTGLPRQAIHFYIQQGLLPAGHKTGRNMAFYGDEHVERLKLIKKLQHERFLPLKAIKALLDDQDTAFSAAQRSFLLGVKQRLDDLGKDAEGAKPAALADEVIGRLGVPRSDLDRMIENGVIGARTDELGRTLIAEDDVWILQGWAEILRLGFARELGVGVDDLAMMQEVVQDLFNRETTLLASRIDRLPPERAAEMIEKALPIVHSFLTGFHTAKIRDFFASLG